MTRKYRKTPGLNGSSMADISFILLSFFLLATSMGSDKGLMRRLQPPTEDTEVQRLTDIKKRNLLTIAIGSDGSISINGETASEKVIRTRIKDFVANQKNSAELPEKIPADIPLLGGRCMITANHLIVLNISQSASYDKYFLVQDQIIQAYNELRNELSLRKFGKSFTQCSSEEQEAIRSFYPQRISELNE